MAEACSARRMKLGSQGLEVSAQGFGWAHYGHSKPETDDIALLHHAIISGVTFLDTSDAYGPHTNELLLAKALKDGMREKVVLAPKFGCVLVKGKRQVRGDPEYVRAACEASLKRQDVTYIDLYYQHRVDTRVPIEITVSLLNAMVSKFPSQFVCGFNYQKSTCCSPDNRCANGMVLMVERRGRRYHYYLQFFRELGIGIVAYSPLGRGFFATGPNLVEKLDNNNFRKALPRFQQENLEHNKILYEKVCAMSEKKGCTPGQLALAWVHHQGDDVCPIPGTTKIENLNQNIGALSVKLTPEDMSELDSIAQPESVKGERYMSQRQPSRTQTLHCYLLGMLCETVCEFL